ncbi:MAG: folate family ECF transporter S component [Tissierella sp.]|uniref:folate family ECF transporter S component n=1 Tax=Tissierella sp. TaxID=41274 RepID=UPI003F99255B
MKYGRKSISAQNLVKGAFLAAISIVLTRLFGFDYLEIIRIGFGNIPIMLSGLLFGPWIGGITGAVADIVGILISARGTPHLGFTLTSALEGIIPGLIAIYYVKHAKKGKTFTFGRVFLAVLPVVMGSSLILNTVWLSQLYGNPFSIVIQPRIIAALIMLPIHSFLIYTIIKTLNKSTRI